MAICSVGMAELHRSDLPKRNQTSSNQKDFLEPPSFDQQSFLAHPHTSSPLSPTPSQWNPFLALFLNYGVPLCIYRYTTLDRLAVFVMCEQSDPSNYFFNSLESLSLSSSPLTTNGNRHPGSIQQRELVPEEPT